MDDRLRSRLHDFTLEARGLLIEEAGQLLEGVYGLLPDGRLDPAERCRALREIDEAAETRRRLELYLAEEREAGHKPPEIRERLLKEVAFTWLNRFVAFKMMEARRLIRQTVSRGAESNGFKLWLTEPGREEELADYERGTLPRDASGEGPRERAYRRFLLWRCGRLAEEIRVLFDPDALASRLCPRPPVLNRLIDLTNAEDLAEAWSPGNEETLGWIYQYFIEHEKKQVFDGFYKKKQKARAQDIPAATQVFTPRWIVKFLVQNTLGRTWIEMHPDSGLAGTLDYLVPFDPAPNRAEAKPAGEIRLLDPACGTMHFGLVAFDLFFEMYREELENAGKAGWPEKPSVRSEDEIPGAIIARNLHGIDIDLRSVQLSALALFLRAKALNPKVRLTESRLVYASVQAVDGDRLDRFLVEVELQDHPVIRRVLRGLVSALKDSEHLGALIRLEAEIGRLVEKEKRAFEVDGRQPDLFGEVQARYGAADREATFWSLLGEQAEQALGRYLQDQEGGFEQSLFVGETVKGIRLLELMSQRYDAVVTNPPYMTSRNMNPIMVNFLKKEYPAAKGDLYAAFIHRCAELAAERGRVGMVTQQSFMFISSYEKLREFLRERVTIESMPHVGPRAFEEVTGEKVNTTLFTLHRQPETQNSEPGTFLRLVREPDAEAKRRRFEQALGRLRRGQEDPIVFRYRQEDFDAISGSPWVYWITPGIRKLFEELPKLGEIAPPRHGLSTCDNFRYLRCWWEVGVSRIRFGCSDIAAAQVSGSRWFPYMKGGSFCRWYGNQTFVLNWQNDGTEIKADVVQRYPYLKGNWGLLVTNPDFYFRRGVTYSYLTSGNFSARLSPGGFIFDVAGSSLFPDDIPLFLALLNSRFAKLALSLINPTVNFQVGDLARLPVPQGHDPELAANVNDAVGLARTNSRELEPSCDFLAPPPWALGIEKVERRAEQLDEVEGRIDELVYRSYGISPEDRAAIEAEIGTFAGEQGEEKDGGDDSDEPGASDAEVALTREELAREWVSYAIGIVMARFQPGIEGAPGRGDFDIETAVTLRELADADGILVQDAGHPDDLASRTGKSLEIMLGESDAAEVVRTATGREGETEAVLRDYLEKAFWKEHIRLYRKRPVYWLLQSPKKSYGVWVFHERVADDTLFRMQREYVDPRVHLLEGRIADLRRARDAAEGRERRQLEKRIADEEDALADVREFARRLDAVTQRGYRHHIDDGVILNMAPLWELLPSWQAEPKKYWEALEAGQYDWSHQAMDHWPDRVKEKCRENRSFAIAHGLES